MIYKVSLTTLVMSSMLIRFLEAQNYAERTGGLRRTSAEVFPFENDEDSGALEYYYDWSQMETEILRWNVEEYPNPQRESSACHRKESSNLCDPDNILSDKQAKDLDSLIRRIHNETSCICEVCANRDAGIQIGIALLKHIYQPYSEHPAKVIRSFAKNLRSKWKLGECDEDILIVVVTEDRQSFTDVGMVLTKYIPVHEAYEIFLKNKAHFTAGQYFEGLRGMLNKYHQASQKISKTRRMRMGILTSTSKPELAGIITAPLLAILIFIALGIFFYRRYKKSESEISCLCLRNSRKKKQSRNNVHARSNSGKQDSVLGCCFCYKATHSLLPSSEHKTVDNIENTSRSKFITESQNDSVTSNMIEKSLAKE